MIPDHLRFGDEYDFFTASQLHLIQISGYYCLFPEKPQLYKKWAEPQNVVSYIWNHIS